jgi:uncharacterized GH25 family protein
MTLGPRPTSFRDFLVACICITVAVVCSAASCNAHEKWLWPNRFIVEKPPSWISFDATWSDQPFTAEMGVGDKPVTVVDPAGRSGSPERAFVGKTKSTCESELRQEGTYRLESVDPLTYWTQVEGASGPQWLKKTKGEVTDKKIMRSDLYWSKAMAYVTVGKSTLPAPLDADPLSIVPATHPNEIFVGSTLGLNVLSYGKPLPKATIKVYDTSATGHAPINTLQCDDKGEASIELKSAGLYLFSCQLEHEVKDDPKADIHSFNVYLTLQVQPAKK